MATGNPFTSGQAPGALNLIAPDIATEQMQLARRQQLADLLKQQALAPSGNTEVIGGWAVKKSPLEGISKIAQALMAGKSQDAIDARNLELAKALQGRMGDILGAGAPSAGTAALGQGAAAQPSVPGADGEAVNQGGVGPTVANAARMDAMPPAAPNNFNMGNLLKGQVISDLGGQAAGSAFWDQFKPTELEKADRYLGINASQTRETELAKRVKEGYIAPVNARPGSILRDPRTNMPIAYNPHVPDGATPLFDGAGNVVGMKPIEGASDAISAAKKAETIGVAQATPTVAFNGTQPVFSTKAQDVSRATGNPPAGSGIVQNDPNAAARELAQSEASLRNIKDPASRKLMEDHIAEVKRQMTAYNLPTGGGLTPQLPPGVEKGQTDAQDALTKSYTEQRTAHQQAQITNSYLDSIVQQAQKAAVGPQSDKLQFANGLLSLMGVESAKDAVTANNLLDKYSNQIVARLGAGGLGTDAARAILTSAYPNSKMNLPAIQEAASNLKGANALTMARTNVLAPFGDKRDPEGYNKAAREFDQYADPRIWELESKPPQEQAAYVKKLSPEVARDLLQRRQKLKAMGAL